MQKRKLSICFVAILTISLIGLCVACLAPGKAPTMELEIYDGPNYSESDDMCYYKVEARVTGIPEPEVIFEYNDNVSPLGSDRVELGVEKGDTYILTASAKNSAGTATVSITLQGKCGENVPDKEKEVVDGEEKEAGEDSEDTPDEEAPLDDTTEPGDEEDGEVDSAGDEPDTVDDGMIAEEEILRPTSESFYMITRGTQRGNRYEDKIIVGDTKEDIWITGFLNFNPETIGGTINRATLHIDNIHETGYASDFGPFIIIASYRSAEIEYIPTEGGLTEIHYSDEELRDYIQYIVDNGYEDFNISLTLEGTRYPEAISINGVPDQFVFQLSDVALTVSYSP